MKLILIKNATWNFLQSSMELFEQYFNNTFDAMEFHGTLASKPEVPWIPWNLTRFEVPWNSMEIYGTSNSPEKSSMELGKFDI